MTNDIVKSCADSLRSHLNDKYNIRLRSGHAHEIVAATFGYNSKNALLADMQYPLSDLEKAEFILLNPPTDFVDQRLKNLENLPPKLPGSSILADAVYAPLRIEKWSKNKIQPTFQGLALSLAKECLHRHLRPVVSNPETLEWVTDVSMRAVRTHVSLTVTFDTSTDSGKLSSYGKVDIRFLRIAGNLGYGKPDIRPTYYSGQMRDPDFRLKYGIS